MKKVIFIIAFYGIFVRSGTAQGTNVGIHLAPRLPIGDFESFANFGLGGGLSFDFYFSEHFHLGLEGEYVDWGRGETFFFVDLNTFSTQLTSAYHKNLGDAVDFYIGSGIGIISVNNQDPTFDEVFNKTFLSVTPRAGLAFGLTDQLLLDFNLRYGFAFSKEASQIILSNGSDPIIFNYSQPNVQYFSANLGLLYAFLQP